MTSATSVLIALVALTITGYFLSLLLEVSDAYETILHTGLLAFKLS